ncbi:PRA1 family protein [Entamoeba marina]
MSQSTIQLLLQETITEINLLKTTKYGMFENTAISDLRFKLNVQKFRILYVSFVVLLLLISLILHPFLIIIYPVQIIPFVIYLVMKKFGFELPFKLPDEYPLTFICITIGYTLASLLAWYYECFMYFFVPLLVGVLCVKAHSSFAICEAECEESSFTPTTSENEKNVQIVRKNEKIKTQENNKED